MRTKLSVLLCGVALAALAATGCTGSYPTKCGVLHGGYIQREHGKPMEGGYYADFDPEAVSIEVTPLEDTNPVKTQHVLIATVLDASGNPLPGRRVEWLIAEGSVGDIVEVDESGFYDSRGYKVDNHYAVTHTNQGPHVINNGTGNPASAVPLEKGQTWCVITSPIEGDTHIIVYAPAVYNWEKHKVFAVKHWLDAKALFPPDASNPVGTPHELVVKVMRGSNGTPLEGMVVNFKIVGGPDAVLSPGEQRTASVRTDASGVARATLKEVAPVPGASTVEMEVIRPEDRSTNRTAVRIAVGRMVKQWLAPQLDLLKTGPARAGVNEEIQYQLAVRNPGKAAAQNTMVVDLLPDGIQYVSSTPAAAVNGQKLEWNIGALGAGDARNLSIRAKTTRTGRFLNPADATADMGLRAHSQVETIVTAPNLALEKTGPAEVLSCEPIPMKVTVRNTGDGAATGVKVTDKLPDGLKTSPQGADTMVFQVGNLAQGEARQQQYDVRATKSGEYNTTAVAEGDGGLRADASLKVKVLQPTLAVSLVKTGAKMQYLNRDVSLEVAVTNRGDGPARNTVVVATLPDGLAFGSASDGGQYSGGKITWNVGTLDPNASKRFTVTAKAARLGSQRSVVNARAMCSEAEGDATVDVVGIPAILLEMVDVHDPIEVGTNETYVITVTNQGSADDTNIRLVAMMPPEEDYVSSEGPTTGKVDGKKIVFEPLGKLAPKARAVWKVIVKGTKAGDVRFSCELTSDQNAVPAVKIEGTHIYE